MIQSDKIPKAWNVHKFGGTSIQNAERYINASRILKIEAAKNPGNGMAVVVSAMKGVTEGLIHLVTQASTRTGSWHETWARLKQRHLDTVDALGIPPTLTVSIENDFKDLWEVLRGVELVQCAPERTVQFVAGYGQIWSAQILTQYLRKMGTQARYLDAREVLIVKPKGEEDFAGQSRVVDWQATVPLLNEWFLKGTAPNTMLIITGFVASTADGIPTTLGKRGSDYTASIFSRLLKAQDLTLWTDQEGVYSADPKWVPDAVVLKEMTYSELTELANCSAKLIHPATLSPAIHDEVPILIRNAFNSNSLGTKIHASAKSSAPVKGFSVLENQALLNLEGSGLLGVSGMLEKLLKAMRAVQVSVTMISQASSESSVSLLIPEVDSARAKEAVEAVFAAEIHQGSIDRVQVITGVSVLAAVGDNLAGTPGMAGQFFSALGKVGVNVYSMAQGGSERNISAVMSSSQITLALRTLHAAFYLSNQSISIGLIGVGTVGKEFLRQLKIQIPLFRERYGLEVKVRGILTTQKMRLEGPEESGIDPDDWEELTELSHLENFLACVKPAHSPHAILIDATASDVLPAHYETWLKSGFHLITPNKRANTQSYPQYVSLKKTAFQSKRRFYYSTNVGAGLPILQTIREFFQTGDQIKKIEGVLSGTLSYLFNTFDGTKPFSQTVLEAKLLGYTEPDPREDLSGMDVARKLVIIGREAGIPLELSDISVENLVSEKLRKVSLNEYLERMEEDDLEMRKRFDEAKSRHEVLRYVGTIDEEGKASVKLNSYPESHVFAQLKSADNSVAFQTSRYHLRPLVIQGPGAGPELTAAGMLADLLKLAGTLGA